MEYEFNDSRFSREECLEAVKYILKRHGTSDQNSVRAYIDGNLRIARTNTGEFEVTVKGKLVFSVPLVLPLRTKFGNLAIGSSGYTTLRQRLSIGTM
jgi:hypothetical protein